MPLPDQIRCVVLDIEGTTTPISFVYDVLFPFARERLAGFFRDARAGTDEAQAISELRLEYAAECERAVEDGHTLSGFGDGAAYAASLMDQDRKSTALKAIQGFIWEEGYRSGALEGQVFPDVPAALETWRALGVRLRIFSSGSVLAQKLLFAHTPYGDLTGHFEGFHDTNVGHKREAASYRAIADAAALAPDRILFLSDVVEELDAAAGAGMATGLLRRPGNAPADSGTHPSYETFVCLTYRIGDGPHVRELGPPSSD